MTTKSRQSIYGASVRAAAERAKEARKKADRLACEAWNKRMLGLRGPAQPSPALGDALNAGYLYLEVRSAATRTRPLRSMWFADRRRHRTMSLSGTCCARTVRRCVAMRTSDHTWLPCGTG